MSNIEGRIKEITHKYEALKSAETPQARVQLAQELVKLCAEAESQIGQVPSSKHFRHRTQISNIRNTAIQVHKESQDMLDKKKGKFDLPSDSRIVVSKVGEEELSRRVGRLILEKEISSKQLKVSPSQFEELAQRMENHLEIQEQIKSIIVEQGGDIDLIEKNVDETYTNTLKANKDLKDAAHLQLRARLAKIGLGISGVLAAVGYSILGIPGMIVGGIVGLFKTVI